MNESYRAWQRANEAPTVYSSPGSEPDDIWDDEPDCSWCGGDGWEECDDPIQCTYRHDWREHPCPACGGSGLAKDQTLW